MARARQAAHNAPAVIAPQGRLTLTTATPVMAAEAANQTTIYYTPYVGDRVPLYNGTEWENKLFTELSIAMAASANWAADSNFDLFVYNDAGTLRLVTGAAWTNNTTRAEALVRTNGIWLNNASFTGRYGASSTVSIAASRATYVGTMRTTSSTGTTTWELGSSAGAAGGDPGKLFLWNCYNRILASVQVNDTTSGWTYASTTIRASDGGTTTFQCAFVRGLNEDTMHATFHEGTYGQSGIVGAIIGIGLDATNAFIGGAFNVNTTSDTAPSAVAWAGLPGLGYHYLSGNEAASNANTVGFIGTASYAENGLHISGMF